MLHVKHKKLGRDRIFSFKTSLPCEHNGWPCLSNNMFLVLNGRADYIAKTSEVRCTDLFKKHLKIMMGKNDNTLCRTQNAG